MATLAKKREKAEKAARLEAAEVGSSWMHQACARGSASQWGPFCVRARLCGGVGGLGGGGARDWNGA